MRSYKYFHSPNKTWGTIEARDIYEAFDKARELYPSGGLAVYNPEH